MYHSPVIIATISVVASLASAHGHGVPHILGLDVADLRAREILTRFGPQIKDTEHSHKMFTLESRADKPQCGPGIGSCGEGSCCSDHGFCGTTADFCKSPGCKYEYGPGCPENKPPGGTNTSSFPRTQLGSLAYGGTGIYKCITPGTVALTYDDGPKKNFTNHILDLFKSYNAKATFFITGNSDNKGPIDVTDEHVKVIKRMDSEGHQIASHTWTHLDLSKNITPVYRRNQMWMNEMALRNIVGKIPTYMRPPYSSCNLESGCQQDMIDLGYHVVYFDVDTDDYQQGTAEQIQNSKDWFKGNITKNGATAAKDKFLSITHDIIEQTATNLTEYMLSTLTQLGYKAVTVGECLGDPKENWYRNADGKASGSDDKVSGDDGKTLGGDGKTSGGDNKTLGGDDKSKSGSTSLTLSNHGSMQLIGTIVLFIVAFFHAV